MEGKWIFETTQGHGRGSGVTTGSGSDWLLLLFGSKPEIDTD